MRGRASLLLLLLGAFGVGAQDNACTWCGGGKDCAQPMGAPQIKHQTPNSVIFEFTHDERCTDTIADPHYYKVAVYECATVTCSSAGSTPKEQRVIADNSAQGDASYSDQYTTFDFDGLDPGNKCAPTRPRGRRLPCQPLNSPGRSPTSGKCCRPTTGATFHRGGPSVSRDGGPRAFLFPSSPGQEVTRREWGGLQR